MTFAHAAPQQRSGLGLFEAISNTTLQNIPNTKPPV